MKGCLNGNVAVGLAAVTMRALGSEFQSSSARMSLPSDPPGLRAKAAILTIRNQNDGRACARYLQSVVCQCMSEALGHNSSACPHDYSSLEAAIATRSVHQSRFWHGSRSTHHRQHGQRCLGHSRSERYSCRSAGRDAGACMPGGAPRFRRPGRPRLGIWKVVVCVPCMTLVRSICAVLRMLCSWTLKLTVRGLRRCKCHHADRQMTLCCTERWHVAGWDGHLADGKRLKIIIRCAFMPRVNLDPRAAPSRAVRAPVSVSSCRCRIS